MLDDTAHRELRRVLAEHGVPRVLLTEPQTLSWLLGVRWNIRHSMHDPVFNAVVHADSDRIDVLATRNESARLWDTEFAADPRIRMRTCEWWEDKLDLVQDDPALGCDQPGHHWVDLSSPIRAARLALSPSHQRTLRTLTDEVADAVETVALALTRSMTEFQVSGQLHSALLTAGIDPLLVLVGSGDRLLTHKHPIPTGASLQELTMLSIGARRAGVVTSVTRYVHFGSLPARTADDYSKLLRVEAAFLDRSAPGESLNTIFREGIGAYGAVGFDPELWKEHHQGGLAGFSPREVLAGKNADVVLAPGHVVAWNPSAHGLKMEDVAIVGDHGCDPLFTDRGHWPTADVHGRTRPHILEL